VDDLVLRPAYAINLRWDAVAWNRAADLLFQFSAKAEPNLLLMIFADPALRRCALAWEKDAPRLLASFRRDFAVAPNDEALANFISRLEHLSPEFRAWWRSHDVDGCARGLSALDVMASDPSVSSTNC
jgi:hypothetical protein